MKNKGNKNWSEEEILRLREIMTRYTVDKEGCKFAAQELGRPYSGVYTKWNSIKPNKRAYSSSKETAKVLYENVSKYPGNIHEAFRVTAEQTGKSKNYIDKMYYHKKSPYHHSKVSTCLTVISKNRMSSNYKNFNSSLSQKTTKQRIKQFIANILGIKKEDL
jgi:hypothetical protein